MTCEHRWKATHADTFDYRYHCDACGFDPGEAGRAVRRHTGWIAGIIDTATWLTSMFIAPTALGFWIDGVWGAIFIFYARFVLEFMRIR